MSTSDSPTGTPIRATDDLSIPETNLAKALVLLHRILPRLESPGGASEIQAGLRRLGALIEAARVAHENQTSPVPSATGPQRVATAVPSEIAAVIAAAVAVVFERPYRLVSVQKVETPVPYLNVWALEGRTQIFHSHKIR